MALYTINFPKSIQKELMVIPPVMAKRILEAIYSLEENPFPTGVKKLSGSKTQYRIRVGNYRVIYVVRSKELIILILKIGLRRDVYD